jgi:hypothetical protein
MAQLSNWQCAGPDLDTVLARYDQPLERLASGEIPAVVLRGAYSRDACVRLVDRLIERELLYDPAGPVPAKFLEQSVPEGYFHRTREQPDDPRHHDTGSTPKRRIDIGTSLGYRGHDQEAFLDHAAETIALFEHLFDGLDDPIALIYERLNALAPDRRVITAHEPDGRRYGPAIIRAHYGGYTYRPHIDSVRLREQRTEYAVSAFEHQFAGVLVLQNTECGIGDEIAQGILHRCLWMPEINTHLEADSFHTYAAENDIENVRVCLDPGDLYFFNTRLVHEVPGLIGDVPRIVLATFIGYAADRDEIFVWS